MNRLWIVGCAVIAPIAVGLSAMPGCASDPCEELGDMCSDCPRAEYVAQCQQAADSGNETVCQAQVNAFDAYCAGSSTGGGAPDAGPECDEGESSCPPGVCTIVATDPDNCGACGVVCEAQVCSAGSCTDSCAEPLSECSGGCVNLRNDPRHCGGCGLACENESTPVCDDGQCSAACDAAGLYPTECSGGCVNLSSDPLNCGECGNACQPGLICSAGSCASECDEGLTNCCGVCVNTMTNPEHCGGCDPDLCPSGAGGAGGAGGSAGGAGGAGGAAGGAGGAGTGGSPPVAEACDEDSATPVCLEGTCAADGGDFFEEAGGACVNFETDPFNCGAAGNVCPPGEVCTDGTCASSCEGGETDCSGSCVNLMASTAHCGECGNVCEADELCSQGMCVVDCDPALEECPPGSGACVDTQTDPEHCGACLGACPTTEPVCSQGDCKTGCDAGLANCNNSCVDLDTNFNHCGVCGNSCNDNSICTVDYCDGQGECKNDSGALVCNDGNQCTNDLCDAQTGCKSEPVTRGQVTALCSQGYPNDWCFFCDPGGASCNALSPDDGIACTDDSCPDRGVYTPADILHVPNHALCTVPCASQCVPGTGSLPDGCLPDDSYCRNSANGCANYSADANCEPGVGADSCGCVNP
ncbi:MAG: hypothetical protein JRI23_25685 [Deltaproteobacteria bacterium]|jgi:hypothetical protein|nr:hypothetical protein [Deltaproteobacteria bacterium]MBW2535419.1 hypothetical protein [Deltaproteobacteria bacterium]